MCMFSAPKTPPAVSVPEPPPPVEQPAPAPQASDAAVTSARDKSRQRRMAATEANQTLVTGGAGLTNQAQTGVKTAFGQ